MNNRKLKRDITNHFHVRCKYWTTCGTDVCKHYDPHIPDANCVLYSPVKYCQRVRGFVYDVPYNGHGAYADDECDPNLAFKTMQDAKRRRAM